jgi:(2Fe-2S) ferredoxin
LLKEMDLRKWVKVSTTNCLGAKEPGPIMVIYPEGVWYGGITPEHLRRIAEEHISRGEIVESLLLHRMSPSEVEPLHHP